VGSDGRASNRHATQPRDYRCKCSSHLQLAYPAPTLPTAIRRILHLPRAPARRCVGVAGRCAPPQALNVVRCGGMERRKTHTGKTATVEGLPRQRVLRNECADWEGNDISSLARGSWHLVGKAREGEQRHKQHDISCLSGNASSYDSWQYHSQLLCFYSWHWARCSLSKTGDSVCMPLADCRQATGGYHSLEEDKGRAS